RTWRSPLPLTLPSPQRGEGAASHHLSPRLALEASVSARTAALSPQGRGMRRSVERGGFFCGSWGGSLRPSGAPHAAVSPEGRGNKGGLPIRGETIAYGSQ